MGRGNASPEKRKEYRHQRKEQEERWASRASLVLSRALFLPVSLGSVDP